MRVRAKICGITSVRDALTAAEAGCDAIGMNFYSGSPRAVDVDTASAIVDAMPPFIARVGVFVDATPAEVEAVLDRVALTLLQFHGDEPASACERYSLPYVKTFSVRDHVDVAALEVEYASARGLLLDTYHPTDKGGTGQTFDWSLWPTTSTKPLVLAGGLTPENVGEAIRRTKPWGVDVSGGVEDDVKGVKNSTKVMSFLAEVHRAGFQ